MWNFDPLVYRGQTICQMEMRGMEERDYIPLIAENMQITPELCAEILRAPYWDSQAVFEALEVLGMEVPLFDGDEPFKYSCDEEAREAAKCMDCGKDTQQIGEYYMLHNQVWYTIAAKTCGRGMLCLGCVESRLGRPLVSADFKRGVPINEGFFPRSDRFLDRIGE